MDKLFLEISLFGYIRGSFCSANPSCAYSILATPTTRGSALQPWLATTVTELIWGSRLVSFEAAKLAAGFARSTCVTTTRVAARTLWPSFRKRPQNT